MAKYLTDNGILTASGGVEWSAMHVKRVIDRVA
jgi:hypothetical protein